MKYCANKALTFYKVLNNSDPVSFEKKKFLHQFDLR